MTDQSSGGDIRESYITDQEILSESERGEERGEGEIDHQNIKILTVMYV